MIGSVAVALGTASSAGRRVGVDPLWVVMVVVCVLVAPFPSLALGLLIWAIDRFRRAAARSRSDVARRVAVLEATELIGLGLAGGLSVAASIRLAHRHGPPEADEELRRLVTAVDRRGVVTALAADRGSTAAISGVLVTATASGAPVLPALEAHLRQEHHRRHTDAVEVARRLPIRLLVPLTLLVLPGFVLITVGPAVIDSLARFSP